TRFSRDWSSDVCSSDLAGLEQAPAQGEGKRGGYTPVRERLGTPLGSTDPAAAAGGVARCGVGRDRGISAAGECEMRRGYLFYHLAAFLARNLSGLSAALGVHG